MKILQKNKDKIVFTTEIDESLANAIRRNVNDVPILAIEEVEISKNDSVLYDEIIAHRLGLVPLRNEKGMNFIDDCSCKGKGCMKCTVELKLQAKGPKVVYSSDLKGKAEIIYEKMPLVLLREDQEIELVAYARMGRGKDHAKFSPGLVHYRNVAEIEVKNCDACKSCVESCPLGLISVDKKAEISDVYKCDLCEACVEKCKKEGKEAIKIKPSKEIIFFIESWGQIEAKEIFTQAVEALEENLKKIIKA